jgi:hypothetical protein
LRGFDRTTDEVVFECNLLPANLSILRAILSRPFDDPLFDSFAVSMEALDAIKHEWDLPALVENADYFLEYMGE